MPLSFCFNDPSPLTLPSRRMSFYCIWAHNSGLCKKNFPTTHLNAWLQTTGAVFLHALPGQGQARSPGPGSASPGPGSGGRWARGPAEGSRGAGHPVRTVGLAHQSRWQLRQGRD